MSMHSVRISRRNVARALAVAPLLPLPVLAATAAPLNVRRPLMGTWIDITIADGEQPGARRAVADAFTEMQRLARLMSRFDPDSRLGMLNRAAGRHAVPVPPEMMAVLQQARSVHLRTSGAFDATVGGLAPVAPAGIVVPDDAALRIALTHVGTRHLRLDARRHTAWLDDPITQLDLGGIAKLPILEAGLQALGANGVRGAMVNGGGDVLVSARADGRAWRIGVRDPRAPDRLLAVVPLREGVVASSGDYERFVMHEGRRYHHVIDPATGRPTRGIRGVTLVGARAADVNGLGTAAMVAGPSGAAALLARCGVERALFVREDGGVWVSPALARGLEAGHAPAAGGHARTAAA